MPNTATNLYNLGFLGAISLLAGWLLRRKESKEQ
ncbi:LPXTG cell wall anchor domain-containing protein [Brevibacillus sp. B_LB10_24]